MRKIVIGGNMTGRVNFIRRVLSSGTEKYEEIIYESVSLSFITKIYFNPNFKFEKIKVSPAAIYGGRGPMKKVSILYIFANKPINILVYFHFIPGTLSAGAIPDCVYYFRIPFSSQEEITFNNLKFKKIKIIRKSDVTYKIEAPEFTEIDKRHIFSVKGKKATSLIEKGIFIRNSSSRKYYITYIWRE